MENLDWKRVIRIGLWVVIGLALLRLIFSLPALTLIALLLILLALPYGFALLEPEEQFRWRTISLNYWVTAGFVFFLLVGKVVVLEHLYHYDQYGYDFIGLGWNLVLWVGILNVLLTCLWFRALRILGARRFEGSEARTRRITNVVIIVGVLVLTGGGIFIRPRMEDKRYYDEENRRRLWFVEFQSAEVSTSANTLTLVFVNKWRDHYNAVRAWGFSIAPEERLRRSDKEFDVIGFGDNARECSTETCRITAKLPDYFSGTDPTDWWWQIFFDIPHEYWYEDAEFLKRSGDNTVYELDEKHYNLLTREVSEDFRPVGQVQFK